MAYIHALQAIGPIGSHSSLGPESVGPHGNQKALEFQNNSQPWYFQYSVQDVMRQNHPDGVIGV